MMKQIKITKYEQNCIAIEIGDTEYYVLDPGSEVSIDKLPSSKEVTAAFVSHSHPDHYNVENLKALNCPIFGAKEVADGLSLEGVNATELLNSKQINIGLLKLTPFDVDHGPISTPIVNFGFNIKINDKSILYLGDIAIPSMIPTSKFDFMFIPVGGSKVFDASQALDFIKSIHYRGTVIPMHYHGRADRQSGANFKELASTYCNVIVLDVTESIII